MIEQKMPLKIEEIFEKIGDLRFSISNKPESTGNIMNGLYIAWHTNGNILVQYFFKNGLREGPGHTYWENGSLRKKCFYIKGEYHGEYLTFYRSGVSCKVSKFEKGVKVGTHVKYNEDGSLCSKYTYVNGIKHGEFYVCNGSVIRTGEYKDGEYSHVITKNSKGIMISETDYKNGIEDGLSLEWWEDGSPKSIYNYKDGKFHGKCIVHYKNGSYLSEINYKMGRYDGKYTTYHKSGSKNIECFYKNGNMEGKYIIYHENGKPKIITNYKDLEFDGNYESYYENGEISEISFYENGKLNGRAEYHKNGFTEVYEWDHNKLKSLKLLVKDIVIEIGGDHPTSILKTNDLKIVS